jgi:hypothetical protein
MSFHRKKKAGKPCMREAISPPNYTQKKKKTIEVANQIQRTLSNMVHDEAKITNKLRIQTGEFV